MTDDQEVRLGSYEMFHRGEPLTETVWEKLILGLSTRNCGQAIRQFTEAYGNGEERDQRASNRGESDEIQRDDGAPTG
jgi:hypothetical protein